ATKKIISSAFAFRLYTSIHSSPALQPGLYAFHPGQSFPEILDSLQGRPNASRFTVLPGFTLAEVASRIASINRVDLAKHFSRAYAHMAVRSRVLPNASTLEGKIGVGEYTILPGEGAVDLLAQMVQRFDAEARSVGLSSITQVEGQTALQIINVASVVEKEGYYVKNMPQVARVIYNRLAKGMLLQMDSTVLYSLGQDGGPVTVAMLKIPSLYNSYLHSGLPPTPICTPSVEALRAAMHPVTGSWLFFVVVDKSGTEAFSNSYAEQLRNQDLARKRGL
ncbi:MAG: endolytic transglycosylase MltG, partial [Actinomycetes bacterium]